MATDPATGQAVNAQGDGAPVFELGNATIPYDILRLIPQESAEHYRIAPLAVTDNVLDVGMVDTESIEAIDALNFITKKTGLPFRIFALTEADFQKIVEMYKGLGGDVDRAVSELHSEQEDEGQPAEQQEAAPLDLGGAEVPGRAGVGVTIQEDAPTIKIVSTILRYAIDGSASDIHIEPTPTGVRVRYRVDGELHTSVVLPANTHRALVARVKVLASIRLDEQRRPQDGRFSASIDNRTIDFRVSTFPSAYGEKVVMRLLDRDQGYIPLDSIGLSERNLRIVKAAVQQPHGLVLISGPTGSGKSTTLYSMLSEVDRERQNVLSLEDPIEYYVEGVTQSQMRPEIGYTFATGLRTTLRQDPDVIMVGEIRDGETAKLAIQAALTGHLVLSTIHTNDAVGVIPRLIDMGVEPYLIPPVLVMSMAQRLTRTLCPDTGVSVALSPSERQDIENSLATLPPKYRFAVPESVYAPERTPTCPTGMRGRMAVFEVMEMSPDMEKVILNNPVDSELWAVARKQGMLTMREDAMLKAFDKKIPFSEVNTLGGAALSDVEAEETNVAEPDEQDAAHKQKEIQKL